MSRLAVVILFLCWVTTGCIADSERVSNAETVVPAPTVHNVFNITSVESRLSDSPSNADSLPETPELRPTLTPLPTLTPSPTREMKTVMIYSDDLHEDWSLENTREVDYYLDENTFVYDGDYAIGFKPNVEYADLAFTVKEEANNIYLRDDVIAVRFWLYTGDDYVNTDDLLVSVIGSNDYPYWVDGDDSVTVQDSRPLFPATRLYFLNIEDDIPPDTWIQIELWLNDLLFEPQYEYVTGVYIKNDEDFFRTIYIDEVELLLQVN